MFRGRARSPITALAASIGSAAGRRSSTRRRWPRLGNSRSRCWPMKPVAPVRASSMGTSPLFIWLHILQRLSKLIPMSFAIFRLHRTRLFAPDRFARKTAHADGTRRRQWRRISALFGIDVSVVIQFERNVGGNVTQRDFSAPVSSG